MIRARRVGLSTLVVTLLVITLPFAAIQLPLYYFDLETRGGGGARPA